MAKAMKEYILPICLAVLTLFNAWLLVAKQMEWTREKEQDNRITETEKKICTKAEIKDLLNESFDVHFNQFEIYLQDKYHITPKRGKE
jgi:hypothetical protein